MSKQMKEFKVVYQKEPFNFTAPSAILVEAEDKVNAFVVTYDYLSRQGNCVESYLSSTSRDNLFAQAEIDAVHAAGVPRKTGDVHIREIDEYKVAIKGRGRVLGSC